MKQKLDKKTMNEDIKKYPVYIITKAGQLKRVFYIQSTDDYNHYLYNLHHYIPKSQFVGNEKWYQDRGIEQKLILMSIQLHEQVHNQAIKNLSDEEFENRKKTYVKPEPKVEGGWLERYSRLVSSANTGAVLK